MLCNYLQNEQNQHQLLRTPVQAKDIIILLLEQSTHFYSTQHHFHQMYLTRFIMLQNRQLIQDTHKWIKQVNNKKYGIGQVQECLMSWIKNDRCPIGVTVLLWLSFLQFQMRKKGNVHDFLMEEISQFVRMIISLFKNIYTSVQNNFDITQFKFKLLDFISQHKMFKSVMNSYLAQFKKRRGVAGELTPSQIIVTVQDVQQLVNFSQIAKPFQKSIKIVELFHIEHSLSKKIELIINTVHQIKAQIEEYRQQFDMGVVAVGFDQLFPIVCFVCEESQQNILASINYINAFLGDNVETKEQLLKKVSAEAFYSIQLMESASSFYCHASQFF